MSVVEWESFAQGLAETLAALPAGALVVIGEEGRYTQFAQEPDRLLAEVAGGSFLDAGQQATAEGEAIITAAGWLPPQPPDRENWRTELAWPASARRYRALAEMVVTALRDGYGIADPGVFRYRAWNEKQNNQDIELPRLGLPRET